MDDSQSSDIFSNSEDYCDQGHEETMETINYDDLISRTHILLSKNVEQEKQKRTLGSHISSVLENCRCALTQSLQLATDLLTLSEIPHVKLVKYLEHAVCTLQMLCSFVTNVLELASMSCSDMKTFPTCIAGIILTIFSHCKDSESLYNGYLKSVEKQLKDLFRSCHELQLTYLMVLEKHFIFDLGNDEEQHILVQALQINLDIGAIVQGLDIKTMAEQWKGITMVCEKYSESLKDSDIYGQCTRVLSRLVINNINTAMQQDQEDKIVLRSLKVISFTIKILLRVCNIFKHSTTKDCDAVMDMLILVYVNNPEYLEKIRQKTQKFINLMNSHVLNPADTLLKELLTDQEFVEYLTSYRTDRIIKQDEFLSYIIIMISTIKCVLQGSIIRMMKQNIIDCIFYWVSNGHVWFNMGLKFKTSNESVTYGLYEYLLTYTIALASTFDCEEMCYLEKKMYLNLLGTECYGAMFASNLSKVLARISPTPFLFSQILSLCKVYVTLEKHVMFANSPQKVHLSYTLRSLFQQLGNEEKMKLYQEYRMVAYPGLWSMLEIKNCDMQGQKNVVVNRLIDKLEKRFQHIFTSGIEDLTAVENLIELIKLTASYSFTDPEENLEDCVVKAWLMLCPKDNKFLLTKGALDRGSLWCLKYIDGLVALTIAILPILRDSSKVRKILHVVSQMIENGNTELKLTLIDLLLKMSQRTSDKNNHNIQILSKVYKNLLKDPDNIVRVKFLNELIKMKENTKLDLYFTNEEQNNIKCQMQSVVHLKEHLKAAMDYRHSHKCLNDLAVIELSGSETFERVNSEKSDNFDFVDIDTLFEVDSDSEPASKRVKLEKKLDIEPSLILSLEKNVCESNFESPHKLGNNEAEEIISRLEKDVSSLCDVKENLFSRDCKVRIRMLCEKLVNIID